MKGMRVKIKKLAITILSIIIIFVLGYSIYKIILKNLYPQRYEEYVTKYAEEYNIDKNFVYALIKAESNFKTVVVSQSGAVRTYATYGGNSTRSCR